MAQGYKIILSSEAEEDIEAAITWIEQTDPQAALTWYEGLLEALADLAHMPQRFPVSPETKLSLVDREIRPLLYGRNFWKYRILFNVDKHRVVIIHVRHGARLYLGQQQNDNNE